MIKTKAIQETERTFKFISVDVDGKELTISPDFVYSEEYEEWLLDKEYSITELKAIIGVMEELNKEKRKLIKPKGAD